MRNYLLILLLLTSWSYLFGQTSIDFKEENKNKLFIKLYGHIDYNQKLGNSSKTPGVLDMHRLVTLFGYQFNQKTKFVTEIEVEHANEIYIEQKLPEFYSSQNTSNKSQINLK